MANGSGPAAILEVALDLLHLTLGTGVVVDAHGLEKGSGKRKGGAVPGGRRRNAEEATAPRERERAGGPAAEEAGCSCTQRKREGEQAAEGGSA